MSVSVQMCVRVSTGVGEWAQRHSGVFHSCCVTTTLCSHRAKQGNADWYSNLKVNSVRKCLMLLFGCVCVLVCVSFYSRKSVKEADLIRDWKSYKRVWLSLTSVLLQTHTDARTHFFVYFWN